MDGRDKCGYTPLHLAAMHDEAEAMRTLLEAGVRCRCRYISKQWPLASVDVAPSVFLALAVSGVAWVVDVCVCHLRGYSTGVTRGFPACVKIVRP